MPAVQVFAMRSHGGYLQVEAGEKSEEAGFDVSAKEQENAASPAYVQ
jgi:hypothetical protein